MNFYLNEYLLHYHNSIYSFDLKKKKNNNCELKIYNTCSWYITTSSFCLIGVTIKYNKKVKKTVFME